MRFQHHLSRWSVCRLLAITTALIWVAGCGGPFTAAVSGRVTYKGNPLPGGTVTFIHPDGRTGYATIQEDGSYNIPAAPGGDVKCIVTTQKPIPALPKGVAAKLPGGGSKGSDPVYPTGKYVPIPAKYGDPQTSGLAYTIHRGSNTIDITLD